MPKSRPLSSRRETRRLEIRTRILEATERRFRFAGKEAMTFAAIRDDADADADAAGPMKRETLAVMIHNAPVRSDESAEIGRVAEDIESILRTGIEQRNVRPDHTLEPPDALVEDIRAFLRGFRVGL